MIFKLSLQWLTSYGASPAQPTCEALIRFPVERLFISSNTVCTLSPTTASFQPLLRVLFSGLLHLQDVPIRDHFAFGREESLRSILAGSVLGFSPPSERSDVNCLTSPVSFRCYYGGLSLLVHCHIFSVAGYLTRFAEYSGHRQAGLAGDACDLTGGLPHVLM